ncbi:MAG: hypothetical protein N3B10_09710 [Armatimonadetes bacterium]|nr:hypothetical protein [Armatimonadota bacterium]
MPEEIRAGFASPCDGKVFSLFLGEIYRLKPELAPNTSQQQKTEQVVLLSLVREVKEIRLF